MTSLHDNIIEIKLTIHYVEWKQKYHRDNKRDMDVIILNVMQTESDFLYRKE